MDSKSRWIAIGFLLFLMFVGPFRILAFLDDLGLYPSATNEQVVAELQRGSDVKAVTCQAGTAGWDFVCDIDVQPRGLPSVRHREGIKTSWARAVYQAVLLPVDGPVLTEAQARQWRQEEDRKLAEPVNIRTATIAELQRIPGVDRYRAQEIHACVRAGIVRTYDDLLKIQGIDQAKLRLMRTRSYWK
jgi:DNA uptake protein ComE-like DNA-binding protein